MPLELEHGVAVAPQAVDERVNTPRIRCKAAEVAEPSLSHTSFQSFSVTASPNH
jgi:hypothetical protein